ncbi:MAG: PAS domain S-box protein [Spirochaetia bacterium]|nr:PAS domain S-box protein [Spirochaetia bacterium]
MLSGTIGEETAVRAIKFGAADYLMKDRIGRLGTAVEQAIDSVRLKRKQLEMEDALRRSQQMLSGIINSALDAIITIDSEQKITMLNRAAEKMFGCKPETTLGKPIQGLVSQVGTPESHPLDFKQTGILPHRSEDFGTVFGLHSSGIRFPIETSISEIENAKGTCVIIIHDVTESTVNEDQLRKSSERFRQVVENIGEVFWMSDIKKDVMIYISPAFEKVWGRSRAEWYESPGLWLETIHPDDQSRVLAAVVSQTETEYEVEYRIQRPDGEVRWIQDRAAPVIDAVTGRPYRIAGVALDITDRKRAELELRERDRQFEEAHVLAQIGSWEFDLETEVTKWSDELYRLLKLDPHSTHASPEVFAGLLTPEEGDRLTLLLKKSSADAEPFSLDHRAKLSDGSMVWLQTRGEAVVDKEGKPTRLRGTVQNISERVLLEGQLQQVQKMEAIGRLSGGVAHDFNNLLTVIMGQAAIVETCQIDEDAHEAIQIIEHASKRAADLTRQLLLFARKQTMQMHQIDLNANITQIGKMLGRVLGEDIELTFALAKERLSLNCDPGMIDQVLINLAVNARDAMPGGGKLFVSSGSVHFDANSSEDPLHHGDFIFFRVADTGSGISPDILPKIFDPFFTTKDVGQGTGLGLSTVFGIVQQHGGWVAVESELNRGTTFSVYFPLAASQQEEVQHSQASNPIPVSGNETILLVEDESAIREMLGRYLVRLGYGLLEAENGPDAMRIWEDHQNQIDLLLTDVVMPGGMSGVELANRLTSSKPGLPVLYMSGYNEFVGASNLTLQEGVNFLPKPFLLPQVAQTIRGILDANRVLP